MNVVQWHPEAKDEFDALRDQKLRLAVLTVIGQLEANGGQLRMPQCRSVKGTEEPKLWELRPSGGQSVARPIYFQLRAADFVILAIAPESMSDRKGYRRALGKAKRRLKDL